MLFTEEKHAERKQVDYASMVTWLLCSVLSGCTPIFEKHSRRATVIPIYIGARLSTHEVTQLGEDPFVLARDISGEGRCVLRLFSLRRAASFEPV